MLLLAADSSGRLGSIALARALDLRQDAPLQDDLRHDDIEVLEVATLAGGMFSAQLVPEIAALLARHGFSKNDIAAFAVASGPGSFTGLRVGLAAVKALAEILGKPIAAVSLLEAVAVAGNLQGQVIAVLDAGRGEFYSGEYDIAGNSATRVRESIVTRDEFLADLKQKQAITPDANLAAALRGWGIEVTVVEPISAGDIARLGWRKIQAGEVVSPEQLEANYIRRTDAEILAKINS